MQEQKANLFFETKISLVASVRSLQRPSYLAVLWR